MNYSQQPPFAPGQGPQWQDGGYPPQYSPAPPPPRRSSAGIILLAVGGVVIIGLVVAIIMVFALGGDRSGGGQVADSPRPQESTSEQTPENEDNSTPDVLEDDSEWIPEEIPDDVAATPDEELSTGAFPEGMDGSWTGTMTQYDPDGYVVSTWDLDVHMVAGESLGGADLYMSNGATCRWDILATSNTEDTIDLEYFTTDDGGGTCTPFGYLHFIVEGDLLFVGVATDWSDGTVSTADGVLSRY